MNGPRISVVIPAKNEALTLPLVVGDLRSQTLPPLEILIADANSTDETVRTAESLGCRIVPGGLPAVGRNRGASEAVGDWILFVDADVRMAPDTLERALATAERRRLDGLSTWFHPDGGSWEVKLNHVFSAWWFYLSSAVGWSHSIGGFVLVRRSMHERLGGFDTGVLVAEDQDYVLRMARTGRYAFLREPAVRISARRFENEGVWKMNLKWLGIEAHRLFIGEVRKDTFRYFDPKERAPEL
jgi:glycosyltransferase involved in cell wall biosynthesis